MLRCSRFRDPLCLRKRGLHLIALLGWTLFELGSRRFLVVVQEQPLVLAVLPRHLACLELDQELLYVLFSLLLWFAVPWVQLLAKSQLLSLFEFFFFKLLLERLPLRLPMYVLIKVEVVVLLLDAVFQLCTLLHTQPSKTDLILKGINSDFQEEVFGRVDGLAGPFPNRSWRAWFLLWSYTRRFTKWAPITLTIFVHTEWRWLMNRRHRLNLLININCNGLRAFWMTANGDCTLIFEVLHRCEMRTRTFDIFLQL